MNAPPLYVIAGELRLLLQQQADEPEADNDQIVRAIESSQFDFKTKATAILGFALELEALAGLRRRREQELAAERQRLEGRAAWWRRYVLDSMRASGTTRLVSDDFTATIRSNPPAIEIRPGTTLPEEFLRTKIISEPDKVALRDALQGGGSIAGVSLTVGYRIDIR